MAGQARRGTRGAGRSSQVASPSSAAAVPSGVGSAPSTELPSSGPRPSTAQTRATYRSLLLRGLGPDEAANLTAYLSGIHVGDQHWKLSEVNQLLFLRELNRSGRFDERNQGAAPTS